LGSLSFGPASSLSSAVTRGGVHRGWSEPLITTTVVYNHSFVPELIGTDAVIDCGANRGEFSGWVSEQTNAPVIAYEPDPRLFEQLPQWDRVTYYNFALASAEGEVSLFLGNKLCSSLVHAESPDAERVSVKAVELSRHLALCNVGTIGLLKLDIEGAELDVLSHLSPALFQRVKQITCEFHEFLDPATLPRVKEVISYVEAQGFYAINFSRSNYGDVLFLNRRFVTVGLREKLALRVAKYTRGMVRLTRRGLGLVTSD
jgi:FkbM family methyltransferase